jgi:hypothetical protein
MKYRLKLFSLILMFLSLSSCASIINTLFDREKCDYTDCDNSKVDNCNYCTVHCYSYNVPDDLNSNTGKSIDKQLKQYRNGQK